MPSESCDTLQYNSLQTTIAIITFLKFLLQIETITFMFQISYKAKVTEFPDETEVPLIPCVGGFQLFHRTDLFCSTAA